MISYELNVNTNIQYDHRNLITQIQRLNTTIEPIQNQLTIIRRMLSEAKSRLVGNAGNRIRKAIFENTDSEALPIINIDNPSGGWVMLSEEYYSRGADGLELAIYRNSGSGAELKQHNIFAGSDNAGKLLPENVHNYYRRLSEAKSRPVGNHLGSIRVIIDPDRQVLSANDFDAWGYYLEGRGYEQTPNYESPNYKFTSKELDRESNYDYFGARYYDSRIGRWGQVEPLMDKYISSSTYCYGLNNPMVIVDPDGKDPYRDYLGNLNKASNQISTNNPLLIFKLSSDFEKSEVRYIYTEKGGFIDLRHFFASASVSYYSGILNIINPINSLATALSLGEANELAQELGLFPGENSAQDPEDRPSNLIGAVFGQYLLYSDSTNTKQAFVDFISLLNPLDENDPKISEEAIYIPNNALDKELPKSYSYNPYHGESVNYDRAKKVD